MTTETAWLLAIVAVLIAAAIGFFAGRRSGAGTARIAELEAEVKRHQDQSDEYRKEVASHFDKTATLFVSMAGSYKQMFEHLSSGYEKLAPGSARESLQQRVDVLLVGDGREAGVDKERSSGVEIAAAATAATAVATAGAVDSHASRAPEDPVGGEATAVEAAGTAKSEADPMAAVGIVDSDTDVELASSTRARGDGTLATDEAQTTDEALATDETLTKDATLPRAAVDSDKPSVEPIAPASTSPSASASGTPQAASATTPESPNNEIRRNALAPAGDPLAEEAVSDDRPSSRDATR